MSKTITFEDSRKDLLNALRKNDKEKIKKRVISFRNQEVPEFLKKFRRLQEHEKTTNCDLIFK